MTERRHYDSVVVGGDFGVARLAPEVGVLPHDVRLLRLEGSVKKWVRKSDKDTLTEIYGA
jgi:hypothetical protein